MLITIQRDNRCHEVIEIERGFLFCFQIIQRKREITWKNQDRKTTFIREETIFGAFYYSSANIRRRLNNLDNIILDICVAQSWETLSFTLFSHKLFLWHKLIGIVAFSPPPPTHPPCAPCPERFLMAYFTTFNTATFIFYYTKCMPTHAFFFWLSRVRRVGLNVSIDRLRYRVYVARARRDEIGKASA